MSLAAHPALPTIPIPLVLPLVESSPAPHEVASAGVAGRRFTRRLLPLRYQHFVLGANTNNNPPPPQGSGPGTRFDASTPKFDKATDLVLKLCNSWSGAGMKYPFDELATMLVAAKGHLFLTEFRRPCIEETKSFIRAWLWQKLCRYANPDELRQAAHAGEFRYLGQQCRNALIDEIRKNSRSKDALLRKSDAVSFGQPVIDDDGDLPGLENQVALDLHQGFASAIGKKPSLEPRELQETLLSVREELTKSLGEPSFVALSTVCGLFPEKLSAGEVTRAIALSRGISEQSARKLHHKLTTKLRALKDHPSIQMLTKLICSVGDPALLNINAWEPSGAG